MDLYFCDHFKITETALEEYGAFNISLVTDLPLFIDPFLLFNSEKAEYQSLHDDIIRYLRFLRTKSEQGNISDGLLKAWYYFGEVKQNWLGFTRDGNGGRGLGKKFAVALNANLAEIFRNFGEEKITHGSHLERLCLIQSGIGRDMISDFTTNLVKDFLLTYTEQFTRAHISGALTQARPVERASFDYNLERWMPKTYTLPIFRGDFVVLTPSDILTRDDTWISYHDMADRFSNIPAAIENEQLRAEINNYFFSMMPRDRAATTDETGKAISYTLARFPQIIEYYIRYKEDMGDQAVASSSDKVRESYQLYIRQFGSLANLLQDETPFYSVPETTKAETLEKIKFFKDVIENKGGHHLFFDAHGRPLRREQDVQILFRLVWHGTPSDVSREVNDGRGPVDFAISRGAVDKTLVEFKLATNTKLRQNLAKQLEIYQAASDGQSGFKVIIYFSEADLFRVQGILRALGMEEDPNIILVDARPDNKPSGSQAR